MAAPASARATGAPVQPRYEASGPAALSTWVVSRGGTVSGVGVKETSAGERGLVFHCAMRKGSTVLRVPLASCGGSFRGAATAAGRAWLSWLSRRSRRASPIALAACWVCEELDKCGPWGAGSDFKAFLASLPSREDLGHLPLFWDTAALRRGLRGSPTLEHVDTQRLSAVRWYAELCACCPEFGAATSPETWAWAVACVLSRTFRAASDAVDAAYSALNVDEPRVVVLLVPLVDMLNHASVARDAPKAPCDWNVRSGAFAVTLRESAAVGAEATIEYLDGRRAPSSTLLSYGFCAPHQSHAECQLRVPLPESSAAAAELFRGLERGDAHAHRPRRGKRGRDDGGGQGQRAAGRARGPGRRPHVRCTLAPGDAGAAATALSLCRVAVATDGDLDAWRTTATSADADAATLARVPKSPQNEHAAFECFLAAVFAARARYGPRNDPEDRRATYATIVRKFELRVLDHFELLARLSLDMLEPLLASSSDEDPTDDEPSFDDYAQLLDNQLQCDENLADNL